VWPAGRKLSAAEAWSNKDIAAEFNSPVVKNGLVFGLSDRNAFFCLDAKTGKTAWTADAPRGGRPGYGSVVDAGSVLLAFTPAGKLIVFEPSAAEFKELATYTVAAGDTFAYPVADGNRVFIKDKNSVTLWTVD
jgi:outer membrane protein assembly factor BamB